MATLLLGVVYFLLATPIGWLSRLLHDPLSRRRSRRTVSYWIVPAGRADAPGERSRATRITS
ncbi:hypothetical protein GCM10010172_34490 [Paractinoplanes ferrugineus]|uniref:Uncharacterized protein n=1 Tax=Paractinoplanes ferrugineus TaxID=113564 RepID=A0A919J9F0_9ACTN|nr:hypothetical protein [Actinoplanes ferrugineus]GIE15478.1 hypothetical protein Afe05nite_73180 [Actinoplanes ferrugineus]